MSIYKYCFCVSHADDVDIARVIEENQEEDFILLTGANALLLVKDEFLKRFNTEDGLALAGEPLDRRWGYAMLRAAQAFGGVAFSVGGHPNLPPGWLGMPVEFDGLEEVAMQLEKAVAFERKLKVKVHALRPGHKVEPGNLPEPENAIRVRWVGAGLILLGIVGEEAKAAASMYGELEAEGGSNPFSYLLHVSPRFSSLYVAETLRAAYPPKEFTND